MNRFISSTTQEIRRLREYLLQQRPLAARRGRRAVRWASAANRGGLAQPRLARRGWFLRESRGARQDLREPGGEDARPGELAPLRCLYVISAASSSPAAALGGAVVGRRRHLSDSLLLPRGARDGVQPCLRSGRAARKRQALSRLLEPAASAVKSRAARSHVSHPQGRSRKEQAPRYAR